MIETGSMTNWKRAPERSEKKRNTVEFLGIVEQLHNPIFNSGEFAIVRQMQTITARSVRQLGGATE